LRNLWKFWSNYCRGVEFNPKVRGSIDDVDLSACHSGSFLYNESKINIYYDEYGDKYSPGSFRESPVGVRGLDRYGKIPSVSLADKRRNIVPAGAVCRKGAGPPVIPD